MKYYSKFKDTMVQDYDPENAQHEANLRFVYRKAFNLANDEEIPSDPSEAGTTLLNEKW